MISGPSPHPHVPSAPMGCHATEATPRPWAGQENRECRAFVSVEQMIKLNGATCWKDGRPCARMPAAWRVAGEAA